MASGGCSAVVVHGASRCAGFSRCGAQALGCMGLVALWHVESSGSGIELVFPALGGFLSTLLPGKSSHSHFEDKICV